MQSTPTTRVLDEIQMENEKKKGKKQELQFLVLVLEKPFSKTNKVKYFLRFFFFEKLIIIQKVKYVLIYLLTSKLN